MFSNILPKLVPFVR